MAEEPKPEALTSNQPKMTTLVKSAGVKEVMLAYSLNDFPLTECLDK